MVNEDRWENRDGKKKGGAKLFYQGSRSCVLTSGDLECHNCHLFDNAKLNKHRKATSEATTGSLPIHANHTLLHRHSPTLPLSHSPC